MDSCGSMVRKSAVEIKKGMGTKAPHDNGAVGTKKQCRQWKLVIGET